METLLLIILREVQGGFSMIKENTVKQLLKREEPRYQWDDQSVKEFKPLLERFADEQENIEDVIAMECNFFESEIAYLNWYFEDDTPRDVIRYIDGCQTVSEFVQSTMNDGVKKLSNGVIARIFI